jgi:hypothetical protein
MTVDLKRCVRVYILLSAFVGAGAHDLFSSYHAVLPRVSEPVVFRQIPVPASPTSPRYETVPNGESSFGLSMHGLLSRRHNAK